MNRAKPFLLYFLLPLIGLILGHSIQTAFQAPEKLLEVGEHLVSGRVSPDGRLVAGVGRRGTDWFLQVWDTEGREVLAPQTVVKPVARLHGLDWSPDSREIAISAGSEVWVFPLDGVEKTVCVAAPGVRTVQYDGAYLMARTPQTTFLWKRPDYKLYRRFDQNHLLHSALNSGKLATACFEDGVRIFDLERKRQLVHFHQGATSAGLQFAGRGRLLASGFRNGGNRQQDHILTLDLKKKRPAGPLLSTPRLFTYEVSEDGNTIVSRQHAGAFVWNTSNGKLLSERPGRATIEDALSPDGKWVATSPGEARIDLWRSNDPHIEHKITCGHRATDLSFDGAGRLLIIAGSATLWEIP